MKEQHMAKKTRKFKAEVRQLLDLVIHSLYSKKEIFLRELISNASDAIDRMKFEALTNKKMHREDVEFNIRLIPDAASRTLTIEDNGIGMTLDEVERNIGTIANSGTGAFLKNLRENGKAADVEFIGQFGVGFYASFMVADKVTLTTKRAGSDEPGVKWVSDGAGSYTMQEIEKEGHGTSITLHLREGLDEYLEEWRLRSIVKEYSDYIAFPVVMEVKRKKDDSDEEELKEETLNSMKAIWKKNKQDVSEEEYNEFYKHVSHDYAEPLKVIHYKAEGTTEFNALLYIPGKAPMDLFMPDGHKGVHLYVKNVFITDQCKELMPEYLRFVNGVVDSSDLPLNVSREMLQDDAIIRKIRKSVTGKVLSALLEMKEKEAEKYTGFYLELGRVLKEGLYADFDNKEKLQELVMYPSSKTDAGQLISLGDYVERMPSEQKEIYYLVGPSEVQARRSPHLEAFERRGYEVLLMVDPVDSWVVSSLADYKGKQLKAIDRGDLDLGDDQEKDVQEDQKKAFEGLLTAFQKQYEHDLQAVRLSSRLTDSASCLVMDENAIDPQMEKIMKAMGQPVPESKIILELNADHPAVIRMKEIFDGEGEAGRVTDLMEVMLGEAYIAAGQPLKNPVKFTKIISKLVAES